MSVWHKPNRRRQTDWQTEFCDLCGAMTSALRLIDANVQGLYGARVCDRHGDLTLNPSFQDLGGVGNSAGLQAPPPLPHAGEDWTGGSW